MVSGLQFFERDPQPGKNRGRGWYYFRGNLTTGLLSAGRRNPRGFTGPVWSFYSANKHAGSSKDAKRPHLPQRVKNISKKEEFQPHKGDYKTRKSNNREDNRIAAIPHENDRRSQKYIKNKKVTRAGEGKRGFF